MLEGDPSKLYFSDWRGEKQNLCEDKGGENYVWPTFDDSWDRTRDEGGVCLDGNLNMLGPVTVFFDKILFVCAAKKVADGSQNISDFSKNSNPEMTEIAWIPDKSQWPRIFSQARVEKSDFFCTAHTRLKDHTCGVRPFGNVCTQMVCWDCILELNLRVVVKLKFARIYLICISEEKQIRMKIAS